MTNWIKVEALRKDPQQARFTAHLLLRYHSEHLTDWEVDFLLGVLRSADAGIEEFSPLQGEKLLQIDDSNQKVMKVGTCSVRRLIAQCYEARNDLSEEDEAWIEKLRAVSPEAIVKRLARRLLRCARQLHLVEGYVSV